MGASPSESDAKAAMRSAVLQRRRERGASDRELAAEAIAAHLLGAAFSQVPVVACYLSTGTEPGTEPLLAAFHERGTKVIVPRAGRDRTLDWVAFEPMAERVISPLGVPEPLGALLGPRAISDAGLVIAPALAVDHAGWRLGRGAGYFDRALALTRSTVCAVVYADELVDAVPHEDHDVPVDLAVTEVGVFRASRRR